MRSLSATDTAKGGLICIALVAPMLWVVHVINRHAEEHGHCAPLAMLDVVGPERGEGDAARERDDGDGHRCFMASPSLSTPLNSVERQ